MLYAKAPVALALTAVSWAVLMFLGPNLLVGLLCLFGLVLGSILIAFCVMHDANHGAYFRRRRYNHLVGWSSDALLGFSSYAWRVKHNVAHHTYTNVDGFDDDATQVPLARFAPSQKGRPWYRFQQYYIWPMYTLMGLRWQLVGRHRGVQPRVDRRERAAGAARAGTSPAWSRARRSSSRGRS